MGRILVRPLERMCLTSSCRSARYKHFDELGIPDFIRDETSPTTLVESVMIWFRSALICLAESNDSSVCAASPLGSHSLAPQISDGVVLAVVSAFRSFDYQQQIIAA